MKSLVDIILPCFNSENTIEDTINSILNQTFKEWTLFVIDDNSADNTKELLKNYSSDQRIKIKNLNKNMGAAFCRNFLMKQSLSKYVAFIDSDDIWAPSKLKEQINFMENNRYNFTYTNFNTFKKNIEDRKNKEIILPDKFNYSTFIKNTSICTSSVIIKRDIIKNNEFTNTPICEDYYFKCQLLQSDNAINLKKTLTFYRISKNSLQSNRMKNLYWVWSINRKFNKLSFIENIISVLSISINSLLKYGLK